MGPAMPHDSSTERFDLDGLRVRRLRDPSSTIPVSILLLPIICYPLVVGSVDAVKTESGSDPLGDTYPLS